MGSCYIEIEMTNQTTIAAYVVNYSGTRFVQEEDDSPRILMGWTSSHVYRSRRAAVRAAKLAASHYSDVTIGRVNTAPFVSNGYRLRGTEWVA